MVHDLFKDEFIQYFIMQHYDQHYESMQMALQQRALKNLDSIKYKTRNTLKPDQPSSNILFVKSGNYTVGDNNKTYYDNERPQHTVTLENFSIASEPVSNAEYLGFMHDDAYDNKQLWSNEGWDWLKDHVKNSPICAPEHWAQDESDNWFGVNANNCFDLDPKQPVYGINYYEACAYAKWRNARLPHEHEWEVASKQYDLQNTGHVWEWCDNRFYPYSGFKAFPYDGYSTPWFKEPHFVLKGGSLHTQDSLRRPSFRNFFGPDKRHIFAGCRLVYE